MTRNETLTLCCLVLILATDAVLIYAAISAKAKVDAMRARINSITARFGLTI